MKKLTSLFLTLASLYATPYTPTKDSEVVASLPLNTSAKAMKNLNLKLAKNPHDEKTLNTLVSLYLKEGRTMSDPRYFGYAQAILKPYLSSNPSFITTMHHIDILQHQHHFDQAKVLLDEVIETKPTSTQPYIMKAIINASLGEYNEGLKSCKKLVFRGSHLLSSTCILSMQSHLGKLSQSYDLLTSIYKKDQGSDKEEQSWSLTVLTQMALSLGKKAEANAHIQKALALNPKDYYMLALYADTLLEAKNYEKIIHTLSGFEYVDALLLRLSIAQKALQMPEAIYNTRKLRAHFNTLELRQERAHLRDHAIFELYLDNNKKKAFTLAKENYAYQKEQGDYAIYVQSARANNIQIKG